MRKGSGEYLAAAAAAVLVAGCTGGSAPTDAEPDGTAISPSVAVVEVADITPMLTMPGELSSAVQFAVTAPVAGVVHIADGGAVTIETASGEAVGLALPEGAVVDQWMVSDGVAVSVALPLARATYPGFALVAAVEGADLLRFTTPPIEVRAQLDGGAAPFDCALLDPYPSRREQHSFIACAIPANQPAVTGMTGMITSTFAGVHDVLSLPVEAVAGTVASGLVSQAAPDGSTITTLIELGLTDGVRVEVLAGLEAGDEVTLPSPSVGHG